MQPDEFAALLRRNIEHASGGLDVLPEDKRAAFWRIVESQAALLVAALLTDERAACADLCEELTEQRAAEMGLVGYDHLTGYQCARAIRARVDA